MNLLINYQDILFNTALIFSSVFEIVLAYILINNYYRPRFSGARFDFLPFVVLATVIIFTEQKGLSAVYRYSAEYIGLLLILFSLYKADIKAKGIGAAVFLLSVSVSQSGSAFLFSLLKTRFLPAVSPEADYLQLIHSTLTNLLMILLCVCISVFARHYTTGHTSFRLWLALFSVPVITMVTFSVYQYTVENFPDSEKILPYMYLSCGGLIFINALVFILFSRLQKQLGEKRNTDVLTAQLTVQEESVKRLETLYNRTRSFRHDIKNHILLMNMLAEQENYGELKKYLRDMSGVIDESDYVRISGISAVDAILNEKLYEAREKNITTEYDVMHLERNNILPLDLCIILSNALDNAISANLELEDITARYIKLKAHGNRGFCLISVSNPYVSPLKRSTDGRLMTTKTDTDTHGFGLKSIENTVKKYNGEMIAKGEDGVFTLVIRLNGEQ